MSFDLVCELDLDALAEDLWGPDGPQGRVIPAFLTEWTQAEMAAAHALLGQVLGDPDCEIVYHRQTTGIAVLRDLAARFPGCRDFNAVADLLAEPEAVGVALGWVII